MWPAEHIYIYIYMIVVVSACAAYPEEWPRLGVGDCAVVGLALATSWQLCFHNRPTKDTFHVDQRASVQGKCKTSSLLGFVEYPVVQFAALSNVALHRLDTVVSTVQGWGQVEVDVRVPGSPQLVRRDSLQSILQSWRQLGASMTRVAKLPCEVCETLRVGGAHSLHCVAVTLRSSRGSMLHHSEPSKRTLRRFVAQAKRAPAPPAELVIASGCLPRWHTQMLAPDIMLPWLYATRYIQEIGEHQEAAAAFARVLENDPVQRGALLANVNQVSYTALRRARVRLDAVAMLVWRYYEQKLQRTASQIYILKVGNSEYQFKETTKHHPATTNNHPETIKAILKPPTTTLKQPKPH